MNSISIFLGVIFLLLLSNKSKSKIINKRQITIKTRNLSEIPHKCLYTDEIGIKYSLCIECNKKEGYFPLNNNNQENIIKYVECYKKETKPNNYYFNKELNIFQKCYKTCETCFGYGDINNNNCSSCKEGFIFKPEIKGTNCVEKCKYYYYTLTGDYLCTAQYYCPKEVSLVIEEMNKCVYDCKFGKEYKYRYNGECIKNCPENTYPNENNICIEKNMDMNKCRFIKKEIKINGSFIDYNYIDSLIKNYVEEFSYTNNYILQYITQNYSIVLYKNKSCLSDFSFNYSVYEFDECITKINNTYNINNPLILIFDRINDYGSLLSSIYFFNPLTGKNLNTNFCNNITYHFNINTSIIPKNETEQKLISQNIDIYNLEDKFYSSLCNNYNKHLKKDVPLINRILSYYPNIILCGYCSYKGINFKNLLSNCEYVYEYKDYILINQNKEIEDIFLIEMINSFIIIISFSREIYEASKISSLLCLKLALTPKNFIVNISGIFILIIFIIQIILVFILCRKNYLDKVCKFIFLVIYTYIENKKKKNKNKNRQYSVKKKRKKFNNNSSIDPETLKRSQTSPRNLFQEIQDNISINEQNYSDKDNETNLPELLNNNPYEEINKSFKMSSQCNIRELKKYKEFKLKKKSILDFKNAKNIKHINSQEVYTENDIREYLAKSPDELDFYKALRRDHRSFCIFLINMIIKKNIIVNTFVKAEETKPIYLKIILFILFIEIYFLSNTFIILTSDIYTLNFEKSFIYYAKITIIKAFESILIAKILRFYIELFIIDKYTIKEMIKLEKGNENNLKLACVKLIKRTKVKYVFFIILNILISTLTWLYVTGFNFTYPNTKFCFFLICIFVIIFEQIISVGLVLVETCLRFIAFKCKVKAIFTLSKYVNGIN